MPKVKSRSKAKRTGSIASKAVQPVLRRRGDDARSRVVRNRPSFEKFLATLSTGLAGQAADGVQDALKNGLKQVVEWFGVDRSTFGEIAHDANSSRFLQCYAVPGKPSFPPNSLLRQFAWYVQTLRRGEVVRLSRLEDLPCEAREEREYARRSGFSANLTVPLFLHNSTIFTIAIGCFNRERMWSTQDIRRLRLIGEVFANSMARQRREEAARDAEKRRQVFLQNTILVPWEFDLETGRFTYVGPQAISLLGYPMEQWFEPHFLEEHLHSEDRASVLKKRRDLSKQDDWYELDYRMMDVHGGVKWLHDLVTVSQSVGEPTILSGFMMDTTASRLGEERLRELSGRLISAQEEERRRIARDLHDDIDQGLALVATELEQLCSEIGVGAPTQLGLAQQAIKQINELGVNVHELSTSLHSAKLEYLGLSAALRALCRDLSRRKQFQVHFIESGSAFPRHADVALSLYRVAQEALHNVLKHSGASEAYVKLMGKPEGIELIIDDDGKGFDPNAITVKDSLGLISMRERLRLVRGEFSIESSSAGTKVRAVVPLLADTPVKKRTSRRQNS